MFHLRSLEQGVDIVAMGKQDQMDKLDRKRKHDGFVAELKSIDTFDQQVESVNNEHLEVRSDVKEEQISIRSAEADIEIHADSPENGKETIQVPYRQKMREESTNSYNIIKDKKMDGLIIAAKQHPTNILL